MKHNIFKSIKFICETIVTANFRQLRDQDGQIVIPIQYNVLLYNSYYIHIKGGVKWDCKIPSDPLQTVKLEQSQHYNDIKD